jgi:hypothetical protein
LSKTGGEDETGTSSKNEGEEHSGSREPSMGESEHRSNTQKSGSEEGTKEDSISTVSMGVGFYGEARHLRLGF